MHARNVLFTGGEGLFCSEMKKILPDAQYSYRKNFDICKYNVMELYLHYNKVDTIVHAAAFTGPPECDEHPIKAMENNIVGTANVVKLCAEKEIKLVYISTDYVFSGLTGMYKEEESVYPVNKYAWSKLGGECAVRMYDNHLIIRTTFGPNQFQHPKAFTDQWTSRESVGDICKRVLKLLELNPTGTFHVGGERRTVLEYARSLSPDKETEGMLRADVNVKIPYDTSLDCSKYKKLVEGK